MNGMMSKFPQAFAGKRLAVIGDFMLDRYLWGSVSRISPEAPVPIVEVEQESEQLGGAANVAHNIAALGAQPYPLGVVGDDATGARLFALMQEAGFETEGLVIDGERPTTIKTRVIAHDQHVVRTDRESRQPISALTQTLLQERLEALIPRLDGIVLEDYNKGVLVQPLLSKIIELANRHEVVITVDPKFDHFFDYRNVTVFKPNRKETEEILAVKLKSANDLQRAGKELLRRLACQNVLITLGADGMALFLNDGSMHRIPTRAQRVHDVSGAGDTVIATLTVALAAGAKILEAAVLANYAAGVVVGELGAVPIDKQKLIEAIRQHPWNE